MGRADLRLIAGEDVPRRTPRALVVSLAAYVASIALLATLLGADAARRRDDPLERARLTLMDTLSGAAAEHEALSELVALRDRAAGLPLDARARAAYAGLLAGTARDPEMLEAAAFHARVAVRLAPVTVPVVRAAVLVLSQSGQTDEAVELVRGMFSYDPGAAARLLALLEPQLPARAVERALGESPRAYLARAAALRLAGRDAEAAELVDAGVARWPGEADLLALAAARAVAARDWAHVAELLPADLSLPENPASAILLVYRARMRAESHDVPGAEQDLERAVALASAPWLLREAGDGWLALERLDRAKQLWTRALAALPAGETALRADLVRRLARLEELAGRSGTALRLWREVLALVPDDPEAGQRIAGLGSGS